MGGAQVEAKAPRAVGDAILAAGCLEYLGPLDSTNREEFKRKALAMFRDAGVLGKRRRAKATIKKLLVAEAWILNPKAGKPKPPGTPTGRGAAGAPPTPTSLAPNEDAEGGGGGASGLKRTLPTPSEGALPTASEGAGGRRGGIKFIGATIAGAEAPARDVPAEVVEPVDDGINLAAAQGFSEDQVLSWGWLPARVLQAFASESRLCIDVCAPTCCPQAAQCRAAVCCLVTAI